MKFSDDDNCDHCWHAKRGPIMMVIPDGHIVQECCKCHRTQTVHADHAHNTSPYIRKGDTRL